MNDSQDDPYTTLNLPRDATQSQIKSAYRKLALKFHPDKQKNEQDKKTCSDLFAKIGNAYEVLGDPGRRAEYDRYGTIGGAGQQQQQQQQQQHHNPFSGFFGAGSPFMNDPFFTGRGHGQQHHHDFMDPFEIFRSVFGQEQMHRYGFDDQGHDNGNGHAHGNGNDHLSRMMGGGGHTANHMNSHMNMMNSMMNMHSPFGGMNQGMMMNQGGGNGNGHSSYSSSSSSTFGGGAGGYRESVSTSTRIINGQRQTVTERTIVKPDGTVERTTETTGDDNFPSALEYNNNRHGNGYNEHQLEGAEGYFGSRR